MKEFLFALLVLFSLASNAQTMKDSFDSNIQGWTEISSKDGEAVIKDGVMHIEGKKDGGTNLLFGTKTEPSFVETHCFAGFDPKKDFEIKCKALVKKIDDNNTFGLILNYIDEGNYIVFVIQEGEARLLRYQDYELVGRIRNQLKLKEQKKAFIDLSVKSSFQKLQFFVNGMLAIESRYLPLTSSGVGFYVCGQQKIDFDDFEIIK